MTCIINGDRRRSEVDGKGLVVLCVYVGNENTLRDSETCLLN